MVGSYLEVRLFFYRLRPSVFIWRYQAPLSWWKVSFPHFSFFSFLLHLLLACAIFMLGNFPDVQPPKRMTLGFFRFSPLLLGPAFCAPASDFFIVAAP